MSFTQPTPARSRVQRCELAVPASNVKMIEKSADSDADFVFLDLEDAVAPGDKVQARKNANRSCKWYRLGWQRKNHCGAN